MHHAVEIPRLSSLILKHDADAPLAGLDIVAPEDRPPVEVVFWSFRIMVGLGLLMFALGAWSLVARLAGKLYEWRGLKRFAVLMGPSGFVAVLAGWITTEVGRQPFTIYGVLRTAESASPLAAPAVGASLVAFVIVYFAVFGMGTWYLLRLMARAPQPHEPEPANAPAHAAGITPAPALAGGRDGGTSHG
jgi:cytochrome d ubiquinol oxidase subunit I